MLSLKVHIVFGLKGANGEMASAATLGSFTFQVRGIKLYDIGMAQIHVGDSQGLG